MKKARIILVVYCLLLVLAIATMTSLRTYRQNKQVPLTRDYPEISNEGILRVVTEYNPTGYFVDDDTIFGFQYELCQAISYISGLEVQMRLEMTLDKCFESLNQQTADIVACNSPITTEVKEHYLFTDPIILNRQVLIQRTAKANHGVKPIRNPNISSTQLESWIMRNDSPILRDSLDHWLNQLKANGT